MTDQPEASEKCVCGHPAIDHCTVRGAPSCLGAGTGERVGKLCGCQMYRACLPWPTSEGWWWCATGKLLECVQNSETGELLIWCDDGDYHDPDSYSCADIGP